MDELKDIVSQRSVPGVLLLDLEDRLLYSNERAMEMLAGLARGEGERLPAEVCELCEALRRGAEQTVAVFSPDGGREAEATGEYYSLRAFLLGPNGGQQSQSHVMVLMERIIRNRQLDMARAREKFLLSKRETEVVRLVCQGMGNKEISCAMFISELTVKDHVKNILRKMGAGSRNEIVAALI